MIILTILSLTAAMRAEAAETARDVLARTLEAIESAPALEVDFTVTTDDGSGKGVLLMSGRRFAIKADGMATWYDGKTQWSYSESTGEVNVTEPTDEELAEINPLLLLNSDADTYDLKLKKKSKTEYILNLADRTDERSIARASITISADTRLPAAAEVEMAGGEKAKLKFVKIKKLNSSRPADFRFNPKDYPGVEVIDLR